MRMISDSLHREPVVLLSNLSPLQRQVVEVTTRGLELSEDDFAGCVRDARRMNAADCRRHLAAFAD